MKAGEDVVHRKGITCSAEDNAAFLKVMAINKPTHLYVDTFLTRVKQESGSGEPHAPKGHAKGCPSLQVISYQIKINKRGAMNNHCYSSNCL